MRALAFALGLVALVVSAPAELRADNCGTPSDCEETAGYVTAIGVVGGLVAVVSGLLGGSATTPVTPPQPQGPSGSSSGAGDPPRSRDPRLIDPDDGEPLLVNDGTYEDGEPGQVWSPWEGWVDPDVAAQHIRERQAEIGVRQREIDDFQAETDRLSEERRVENERRAAEAAAQREAAEASEARREESLRKGRGLVARVDDPVKAQKLEDFLDRHADDPDALDRAVAAIRKQTFEAEQQRTLGESEAALLEEKALERSEQVATKIEIAAKAGVAAVGGGMVAAGAATAASAMGAAAAATGAISGAEAGSESYQRGDSLGEAVQNVAAATAIGAAEGAIGVGINLPGAGMGVKMAGALGQGFTAGADHLRRGGEVRGAVIHGTISFVGGSVGHGIDRGLGRGVLGTAADAAAAYTEGGMHAKTEGQDFHQGGQQALEGWMAGKAGGGMAGRAAGHASDAGGAGTGSPRPPAADEDSAPGGRPADGAGTDEGSTPTIRPSVGAEEGGAPRVTPEAPATQRADTGGEDSGGAGAGGIAATGRGGRVPAQADAPTLRTGSPPEGATPPKTSDPTLARINEHVQRTGDFPAAAGKGGGSEEGTGGVRPVSFDEVFRDGGEATTPKAPAEGAEGPRRHDAEDPTGGRAPKQGDDLDALIRGLEKEVGPVDVEPVSTTDPRGLPEFGGDDTVQQGRGISAEEARRREVWLEPDGTRVAGEGNPEDNITSSRIRIDPDTGEVEVRHHPDTPNEHKAGIEARLRAQNQDRIQAELDAARARNQRIADQQAAEQQRIAAERGEPGGDTSKHAGPESLTESARTVAGGEPPPDDGAPRPDGSDPKPKGPGPKGKEWEQQQLAGGVDPRDPRTQEIDLNEFAKQWNKEGKASYTGGESPTFDGVGLGQDAATGQKTVKYVASMKRGNSPTADYVGKFNDMFDETRPGYDDLKQDLGFPPGKQGDLELQSKAELHIPEEHVDQARAALREYVKWDDDGHFFKGHLGEFDGYANDLRQRGWSDAEILAHLESKIVGRPPV